MWTYITEKLICQGLLCEDGMTHNASIHLLKYTTPKWRQVQLVHISVNLLISMHVTIIKTNADFICLILTPQKTFWRLHTIPKNVITTDFFLINFKAGNRSFLRWFVVFDGITRFWLYGFIIFRALVRIFDAFFTKYQF